MMRILFVLVSCLTIIACTSNQTQEKTTFKKEQIVGETMGTNFMVTYLDSTGANFTNELQQLLIEINDAVSTYIPSSEISTFNQNDSLMVASDGHFVRNFLLAQQIYQQTGGWFNPSVMPLVNFWGFGYTKKEMAKDVAETTVDSLLQLVQFDSIAVVKGEATHHFYKKISHLELDFSAIAKGDAVDEVGRFLESKGIHNYFVEIGGEVRARGRTISGYHWRTGIRKPKEGSAVNELQVAIELDNIALATSGNYENYYEDKSTGQKYAHTINPHTGYPERNSLLSASVFAKNCATADALATAFMGMGVDKAFELAEKLEGVDVYLVYSDAEGNLNEKYTAKVETLMQLGKQ